jgi:Fic family protein
LEGNTYSLLDTERLISLGETADNKSAMEAQMILNHKDAIEFIVQSAEEIDLNRYTVLNLHGLLSNNLLPDPAASGRLRRFGVGIGKSVYTPLVMPQLIEEMFELMLAKARQIENPFEQAFFIMVQLPYLQPFEDVNKRVSRLAANIPLNRQNLAPLSFVDVPDELYIRGLLAVYELNRVKLLKDVFLWAYERSAARYAAVRQSLGEPDVFRLKYRDIMRSLIADIVSTGLGHREASERIQAKAKELSESDQAKFVEAIDTELLSLHEGNFARYWITPAEFNRWKEIWERD